MHLLITAVILPLILHSSCTLIGYNSIPEVKLPTLERDDPAYALTVQRSNDFFRQHCGIQVRQTISVAYRIVGGIKYNIVFDTLYGPVNSIAVTQYWEKSVDVQELKFVEPDNKTNTASSAKSSSATTSSNSGNVRVPPKGQNQYKFPELKNKCDQMKNQIDKLQGEVEDGVNDASPLQKIMRAQAILGSMSPNASIDQRLAALALPRGNFAAVKDDDTFSSSPSVALNSSSNANANSGPSGGITILADSSKNSSAPRSP